MKWIRKIFIASFVSGILIFVISVAINFYIYQYSKPFIKNKISYLPQSYTALVLGAMVYRNHYLSAILHDRVYRSLLLYKSGKVKKFLLSGDHGRKRYDEVNTMKKYLLKKGVPGKVIFLDHAGFNTYNSAVRARKVFLADRVIIVTQRYHLFRAIFIARKKGLNAYGFPADRRKYRGMKRYKIREFFANIKAFCEVLINKRPKFLGDEISIKGSSFKSWD